MATDDNVVKLPDLLERRAQKIEAALDRQDDALERNAKADKDWKEATLELAIELAGAKHDLRTTNAFGKWCDERFGDNRLSVNDRAALARWGLDPEQTRLMLAAENSRSIQMIDRRLCNATKSPRFTPGVGGNKTKAVHAALQANAAAGIKLSQKQVAQALNVSAYTVGEAVRDLKAAQSAETFTYTKAQDAHVEARLKALSKQLESDFNERVRQGVLEANADYLAALNQLQKEASEKWERYDNLINSHQPPFTETEFITILTCLHPDNSASKEKRDAAFKAFNAMKFQLTGKK